MDEPTNVIVLDRVERSRREQLVALFRSAWWTKTRDADAVERMLEGSDLTVGLVDPASDRLIGFARAITDHTFLAVVLDVIVDPDYRGTGLGARLMNELLAQPELAA
ncbi:MAG TPA: GNAT family N-acetyltransferase, partial [Gaiellaceae bacterium]